MEGSICGEAAVMHSSSVISESTINTKLDRVQETSRLALTVEAHGLTDKGRVRPSNEDNFLIAELTKAMCAVETSLPQSPMRYSQDRGHLFVVADGMGGHQAGERASALALQSIQDFALQKLQWFSSLWGPEGDAVLSELQSAVREADALMFEESRRRPELRGMGTTLTLAYHLGTMLFVVHVGDSRCYLFRNGELSRITHDHTLVAELTRKGIMSREEAASHKLRHVIVNVVGGNEAGVRAEAHKVELESGDLLLLCSDGLTEMVDHQGIATILSAAPDPRTACERLVAEASENGGLDNITVVAARFTL
jgi:protein phosphatase